MEKIMTKRNNLLGSAILALASLLWGLAFVFQGQAAEYVPPFLFNALRSFVGVAFLMLLLVLNKFRTHTPIFPTEKNDRREYLIGGLICGVLLTISVNFQQFGIAAYPEGVASEARAGFLTALYVVFVPLTSLFIGRRVALPVIGAGVIAMAGIYLLSFSGGIDGIYIGDILVLLCALCFTAQIMAVDHYGAKFDGMLLCMTEFFVCGILSLVLALFFEEIVWQNILAAAVPILYTGVVSSGIAYTLQIYGQKYAEPAIASLTMSLESVFAALGGWLIGGSILSPKEFVGCGLVFAAIILAQLPQLFESIQAKKAETEPKK